MVYRYGAFCWDEENVLKLLVVMEEQLRIY